MTFDTEFGNEYAIEQPILDWFEAHGFGDASWHNNICPSFTLEQGGEYIVEIFVDAQSPTEREAGPGPRFSTHWFDDDGDPAEHFDFRTFAQVQANFTRIMETKGTDAKICERCELRNAQQGGDYCKECDERLDNGPAQRLLDRSKDPAAVALGRKGGLKGGKARAASLSPEKRSEIASKAAKARWNPNKWHLSITSRNAMPNIPTTQETLQALDVLRRFVEGIDQTFGVLTELSRTTDPVKTDEADN